MGKNLKKIITAVICVTVLTPASFAMTVPHPGVKNCPQIMGPSGPTADHQCENNYKAKLDAYNAEVARLAAVAAAKQTADSATAQLAQIEQQNKDGQSKQLAFQTAFQIASMAALAKFYSTCPKCQSHYMYASIAASIASSQSGQQAGNHGTMAYSACGSYNQLASGGKTCGTPTRPFDPNNPSFPNQEIDPLTGMCRATAPPSCTTTRNSLLADKSFDSRLLKPGAAGFAGVGKDFKVNADGSITTKDGKTFKASDFADEKSMIAAGVSAKDAALAFAAINKDGTMAKLNKSMQEDLKKSKYEYGAFGGGEDGGSITIKTGGGADASALGTRDIDGALERKRNLASDAGLVRDFNGDAIGISNDDIFKMMNKRYILKKAQDSFIGQ